LLRRGQHGPDNDAQGISSANILKTLRTETHGTEGRGSEIQLHGKRRGVHSLCQLDLLRLLRLAPGRPDLLGLALLARERRVVCTFLRESAGMSLGSTVLYTSGNRYARTLRTSTIRATSIPNVSAISSARISTSSCRRTTSGVKSGNADHTTSGESRRTDGRTDTGMSVFHGVVQDCRLKHAYVGDSR
jgi:hypothetical protein